MSRIRLAIIGLGMAVKPHALSLRDLEGEVEVVAVFSPSSARREAFANEHRFPACADSEAIFSDATIDAVMLLTPPNTHLDLVRRAAASGKHILLEKPLEISLDRAEQLVAAAEAAQVKLAIVLQHRFRPVSVALAKLVSDGRLGTLVSAAAGRVRGLDVTMLMYPPPCGEGRPEGPGWGSGGVAFGLLKTLTPPPQ